jgi:CheY-like chemotaxis protein
MRDSFTILIADRNRHIRELLRREFEADGYQVRLAKDGKQVWTAINSVEPLDLLILDLEIPYVDGAEIIKRLMDRKPPVPVVIHTFFSEDVKSPAAEKASALVEKTGDNIVHLKSVVEEVLQKFYPRQCAHLKDTNKGTAKKTVLQTQNVIKSPPL